MVQKLENVVIMSLEEYNKIIGEQIPPIKALGTRTDCFIIGEVTEKTEDYVLISGLKFLNDQVTILSEEDYRERRKAYDTNKH